MSGQDTATGVLHARDAYLVRPRTGAKDGAWHIGAPSRPGSPVIVGLCSVILFHPPNVSRYIETREDPPPAGDKTCAKCTRIAAKAATS